MNPWAAGVIFAYIVGAVLTCYNIAVRLAVQRSDCKDCSTHRRMQSDGWSIGEHCTRHWNDKMLWALIWPVSATGYWLTNAAARRAAQIVAERKDRAEVDKLIESL